TNLLATHSHSLTPVGAAATIAFFAACGAVARGTLRQARLRAPRGSELLAIIPPDVPTAFALPGRPGQIVAPQGMLRKLDPRDRRVLLAHERAHLRCHHHRYLRLVDMATTALPVLAPIAGRVRHAAERWADEEAAREVGSREAVATAIVRAAYAQ